MLSHPQVVKWLTICAIRIRLRIAHQYMINVYGDSDIPETCIWFDFERYCLDQSEVITSDILWVTCDTDFGVNTVRNNTSTSFYIYNIKSELASMRDLTRV